jgi:uncharacterized membrane protein YoaK (UPF0700 family)
MFIEKKDQLYYPENIFVWFVLAFQGGIMNVGGFMAVHRFVSHVTGFATLFGYDAITKDWTSALGMLSGPLFYIFGTMVSAWFIERPRMRSHHPRYGIVFLIMIFCLLFISIFGTIGVLGTFGEDFNYGRDYILLFVLALTCGLQNAVISSASGAVIRTTHLTGPTTDLGIGLVRLWTSRNEFNRELIFANWCRAGIIVSFIMGSLIGAVAFNHLQFLGFFLPVIISIFVMFRLKIHKHM